MENLNKLFFQMDLSKASGLDHFGPSFYQKYKDIIGLDI